jgi:hypothetical protein
MITNTIVPISAEQGVLDSGCTSNIITSSTPCIDKVSTNKGLRVSIPNGQIMKASHNAKLDLRHLPIQLNNSAREASVQPCLQKSLRFLLDNSAITDAIMYYLIDTALVLSKTASHLSSGCETQRTECG